MNLAGRTAASWPAAPDSDLIVGAPRPASGLGAGQRPESGARPAAARESRRRL